MVIVKFFFGQMSDMVILHPLRSEGRVGDLTLLIVYRGLNLGKEAALNA